MALVEQTVAMRRRLAAAKAADEQTYLFTALGIYGESFFGSPSRLRYWEDFSPQALTGTL